MSSRFCAGDAVRVEGLISRSDLNRREGKVLSWSEKTKRCAVSLSNNEKVLVKPCNLVRLEKAAAIPRIRPQDAGYRLAVLAKVANSLPCEAAIAEYTAIINLLSSQNKFKSLYKQELSDSYAARSMFFLKDRRHVEAVSDASEAIRADKTNDGAYFTRAACLISNKDFSAAIADLTMVVKMAKKEDVQCLVKRAYCHQQLEDFRACCRDMERAQNASLNEASKAPEFISVQDYIADQLSGKGDFPKAIAGLTKALSVLSDNRSAALLTRRSYVYLMAGNLICYAEDLDKAQSLDFSGVGGQEIVDLLLSKREQANYRAFDFNEPLTRPFGAYHGDVDNIRNEQEYGDRTHAERARETLRVLKKANRYAAKDANHSQKKRLLEVANLREAGSRFAEELYHQSHGFATIIQLIRRDGSSYEGRRLALTALKVVSVSGNRRLCKALLKGEILIDSLLTLMQACTLEAVAAMAEHALIHYCPVFVVPTQVPDLYRKAVLAEQAGELLLRISLCASPETAASLVERGAISVFEGVLNAYEPHWTDSNTGEGILLGSLRCNFHTAIDHLRQLCGEDVKSREGISRRDLRDLTRAGQRCSNPDCPQVMDKPSLCERTLSLKECTGCNINAYCSKECQAQHWPAHQVHCRKY